MDGTERDAEELRQDTDTTDPVAVVRGQTGRGAVRVMHGLPVVRDVRLPRPDGGAVGVGVAHGTVGISGFVLSSLNLVFAVLRIAVIIKCYIFILHNASLIPQVVEFWVI